MTRKATTPYNPLLGTRVDLPEEKSETEAWDELQEEGVAGLVALMMLHSSKEREGIYKDLYEAAQEQIAELEDETGG